MHLWGALEEVSRWNKDNPSQQGGTSQSPEGPSGSKRHRGVHALPELERHFLPPLISGASGSQATVRLDWTHDPLCICMGNGGSRECSVSTRTTASSCKSLLCCLSLSTICLRLVCFSEEPWWIQDFRKFFSDSSQFEVLSLPFQDSLVTQLVKNLPAMQETQVGLLSQEIPWRRAWQPTPVFLPGKSHGWRSLVIYSPWGRTRLSN